MKKKIVVMSLVTVACLTFVACGKKEETAVQTESQAMVMEETTLSEETSASEVASSSVVAEGEMESVAAEKNEAYEDIAAMPKEELAAFAESIKTCVADKNIEGLADLVAYPTYVALGDGMEITTKEDFVAIGADTLFTEELVAAIKDFPTDNLETSMAGVVLGETKPNISFKLVDGKLGIQGINY